MLAVDDEAGIKRALSHATIDKYAYIFHDKDPQPPHWQGGIKLTTPIEEKAIYKWFDEGVKVEPLIGKGAFNDLYAYLSHEGCDPKEGKHIYGRYEVKANFTTLNSWQKETKNLKSKTTNLKNTGEN